MKLPPIYVAGHRGKVCSAVVRRLVARGDVPANTIILAQPELVLGSQASTGLASGITAQDMCTAMVKRVVAHAKQHALLKKHVYAVNVSVV